MALYEEIYKHLLDYQGVGEAPEDHRAYWDKALEEVDQLDLAYELVKKEIPSENCEAYHLYFYGVGGAKIHAQLLKPKNISGKAPAIAMFHGYWSNSGDFTGKLTQVSEGYVVLAMDVRGQGGESVDNGFYTANTQSGHIIRGIEDQKENLFYRNVFLDTVTCIRILKTMDFVDANKIGVTGASQGGALAVACAALEPSVVACAPMMPFLSDFQGIYLKNFYSDCYEELVWYFKTRDPLHKTEKEFFEKLSYIDIKNLSKYIQGEVLWFMGLKDKICPPFSQLAAYNQITAKKDIVVYPEFAHEWYPQSGDIILEFFKDKLK